MNVISGEMTVTTAEGWKLLGNKERRDNLIDIFNETGLELRVYFGQTEPTTELGVPIAIGGNYYIEIPDDEEMQNDIWVKTTSVGAVTVTWNEG